MNMTITMQQTFDKVVAHLRKQGCQSKDIGDVCLYRGPNGTKCAAGCLIPDELYTEKMERCGPVRSGDLAGQVILNLGHDLPLVKALQDTHDSYAVSSWEYRFLALANAFNLIYTPPLSEPFA